MNEVLEIPIKERLSRAVSSEKMNALEAAIQANLAAVIPSVKHCFTKGDGVNGKMYIRSILMEKGTVVTSKIHKWEHPFFVMTGSMTWFNERQDEEGAVHIQAPYFGVTQPGTRRAIIIHEDVIMSACYATDLTDVKEIERLIIEPHVIPENTFNGGT